LAVTLPARYPDLQVRGLIVAAATLWGDTPLPPALRLAKAPALNTLVAWGVAGNPVGLRLLYDVAVHNKEEVRWRDFRRHFPRAGRMMRGIAQRNLADLQHRHAQIEAILPTLACPTLLLWGDDDPISPVQVGERLRAQVPDALLKIYAYTGHFVPEERPVESAEDIVLRFHHDPLPFKGAA
jgi:pimeloyl-ACP methyl ester carboxylesterase